MSVQQRLVVAADVEIVLRRMPSSIPRRQLIVRTVADVSGGAHSLGELDLIALCRSEGLPSPTRQHRRDGRYLDAVWREWGVWVEVDGAHHMSADQWWDDMARHNELVRRNEVLLRFPAWMVRDRPTEVADRIRRALREAGWN
jgi:very-short-patch-repair endonuclease